MRRDWVTGLVVAVGAATAGFCMHAVPAGAHGFGQRYDLPLPLSLYLLGAGAAVILSFIVVGLCARHPTGVRHYPRINLTTYRLGRWLVHPIILALLKFIGAGVLILTVIAGFFGNQDPYRNIAPTLVWIVWWVSHALRTDPTALYDAPINYPAPLQLTGSSNFSR